MGSLTYRTLPSSPGAADPQITAETLVRGTPKHLVCDRNRPVLKQLKGFDKVLDEPQIQAILAVAGHLSDIQRLDLSPSYLRTYSQAHRSKRMGERGENFAALVREILADAQLKEAYVSWLRQLRPAEVDDVKIVTGAMDDPVFMLREGNREFAAPVLSDGTLRFAAITAALFQPDMPATMLFEEIENGIHPSRLRLLVELMRSRTNDRGPQLMATTHSPTVLAWLTPEEHAHTFFCKREDDGASRICALTEVPHFREVIAKQPIGDLLTEGWLEAAL
jgi:predicted ATPase